MVDFCVSVFFETVLESFFFPDWRDLSSCHLFKINGGGQAVGKDFPGVLGDGDIVKMLLFNVVSSVRNAVSCVVGSFVRNSKLVGVKVEIDVRVVVVSVGANVVLEGNGVDTLIGENVGCDLVVVGRIVTILGNKVDDTSGVSVTTNEVGRPVGEVVRKLVGTNVGATVMGKSDVVAGGATLGSKSVGLTVVVLVAVGLGVPRKEVGTFVVVEKVAEVLGLKVTEEREGSGLGRCDGLSVGVTVDSWIVVTRVGDTVSVQLLGGLELKSQIPFLIQAS